MWWSCNHISDKNPITSWLYISLLVLFKCPVQQPLRMMGEKWLSCFPSKPPALRSHARPAALALSPVAASQPVDHPTFTAPTQGLQTETKLIWVSLWNNEWRCTPTKNPIPQTRWYWISSFQSSKTACFSFCNNHPPLAASLHRVFPHTSCYQHTSPPLVLLSRWDGVNYLCPLSYAPFLTHLHLLWICIYKYPLP